MGASEIAILINAACDIIATLRTLNITDVSAENIESKIADRQVIIEQKYKEAMSD